MSLRWGICGAGKISHDFVVALKTRSEHRIVAVSARSVDSSSKFAATHDIKRFYGTYEELASDKEVLMGVDVFILHSVGWSWS